MRGTRKIVRLDKPTTSSALVPTVPAGALPSSVSVSASAVISKVVAMTQRFAQPVADFLQGDDGCGPHSAAFA